MTNRPNRLLCSAFALALVAGGALYAQDQAPEGNQPPPPPTREGGGGPGGPGGPGGFGGRFGMMRGAALFANNNRLDPFVNALAEVNLSPEFNLTAEQERKIATIREDFKKAYETWRKDHRDQIDDIIADWRDMRRGGAGAGGGGGGGGNEEKMRELMEEARDLNMSAPDGEEAIKSIKALLTEEQVKQVEAKQEQHRTDMDRRRAEMGGGFGGGFGGGPGGGGPGGERGPRREGEDRGPRDDEGEKRD